MPYIGNTIRAADDYRLIDDISSGFNGSATSFALQVAGSAPVPFPKSPQQILISVNGVIQEPDPTGSSGFNLVGTNIVFSSAPANGHAFFGIIYATADYLNAGGNFPAGSLGAPSITFIGDENSGLYRKGGGSVGFVSDATEIANFDSNGITISSGNLIIPGDIIHNGDTNTKIRFPADNQFTVETGGSQRMSLSSSGIIFNETGEDVDFRIEGSGQANLFKADAGTNRIGIGTGSPQRTLHLSSNNTVFALTDTAASTDEKTKYILSDAGILAFGKLNDAYDTATEQLRLANDGALTVQKSGSFGNTSDSFTALSILSSTSGISELRFGDTTANAGHIKYEHTGNNLIFATDASQKMRLTGDASAQLLLGTTSTTSSDGVITGIKSANVARIIVGISNTTASGVAGYDMLPSNTVTGARIECRATEDFASVANRTADLGFYTRKDGTLAEKLTILSNGNVGIGTTSPARNLTVTGSDGAGVLITSAGTTGGGVLRLQNTQGSNQEFYFAVGGGDNAYVQGRGLFLRDETSGANRISVLTNGNVGIGTTNPTKTLHVAGAIFANGGTLEASLQGDILNQTNPALVLKSSTNTNMRTNFLLEDDYVSGRGCLAINVTEVGVTNDRDLLLQRSGGRLGIGTGTPETGFHCFAGSDFRIQNASIPFIRLKSTNTQGSNHADYGRIINDVAGTVTGLLDWKRQSATDDSYFTIFNKESSNNIQERLRITSRGALCVHAAQQTNQNNMNVDSQSMPKYFENTGGQDSNLVGADIHFQTVIRGTSGITTDLFTFQGGGNCGFFCEVTAYFSSAVSDFQGRQRMWWRAIRTSNANFSITQAHNYDKVGSATNVYFNPLWTSSGSGSNQVLGVRVQTTNMGAYVRFWFVARIIAHDSIGSMTINR